MTDSEAKAIDKIMEEFEFSYVQEAMSKMNWVWATGGLDSTFHVPTINQLRTTAHRLLVDVVEEGHTYHSTGGFVATLNKGRYLTLQFVLKSEETDIQCDIQAIKEKMGYEYS